MNYKFNVNVTKLISDATQNYGESFETYGEMTQEEKEMLNHSTAELMKVNAQIKDCTDPIKLSELYETKHNYLSAIDNMNASVMLGNRSAMIDFASRTGVQIGKIVAENLANNIVSYRPELKPFVDRVLQEI